MIEFGIFNDESATWSAEEAVEAGFYTEQEAIEALGKKYALDDCVVHICEEDEDEDEDEV